MLKTTIGIESFPIIARHGVYDFEHKEPQNFIVTIRVVIENEIEKDELEQTVDYALLQRVLNDHIKEGETTHLMETLAKKIILDLKEIQKIDSISIHIEKPDAKLPFEGGLPFVECTWSRR